MDINRAESLWKHLAATNRRPTGHKIKWAEYMRILREREGEEVVAEVFDWFLAHGGDPAAGKLPTIFSAKNFAARAQFQWIRDAMERHRKKAPAVTIDPKIVKAIGRLKVLGWRNGSLENLPVACQLTYERFQVFRKKLDGVATPKDPTAARFLERVRRSYPYSAIDFMEHWMHKVHDSVKNWPDWSGDVIAKAFSEESKEFRAEGHSIANKWGRGPELWDRLMEAINE